jgi:hypothetical protein
MPQAEQTRELVSSSLRDSILNTLSSVSFFFSKENEKESKKDPIQAKKTQDLDREIQLPDSDISELGHIKISSMTRWHAPIPGCVS